MLRKNLSQAALSMSSSSDSIQNLVDQILSKEGNTAFYTFANADGKQWIMPKRNMQTAMNLYQPSGIKGKAMKRWFPYLHHIGLVKAKLKVTSNKYKLQRGLSKLLCEVFGREDIEFALFCGTPSAHQKTTIQISAGTTILGYCKITDKEEVVKLFCHEQHLLNTLERKGVKQIPQCLFCDNLTDKSTVFVQSTVKSNRSVVKHDWTNAHWAFLTHLHNRTKQTLLFHQTDFARSLTSLTESLMYLPATEVHIILTAIRKVQAYYDDSMVEFSAYHADFTPWNMFFEKGKLFVFDFEYAKMSYPPFLDRFHYFTQCCIFEKGWKEEQIFEAYQSLKKEMEPYMINPDMGYLCYLLEIVTLYLDRDNGMCANGANSNFNIWISLIDKLTKA